MSNATPFGMAARGEKIEIPKTTDKAREHNRKKQDKLWQQKNGMAHKMSNFFKPYAQ